MFGEDQPLAERMRPTSLSELVGQQHLIGEKGVLRLSIAQGKVPSMIFWGPPGVGKTTIANIIANQVKAPFQTLSAISAGVKDVREVIQRASRTGRIILFIDEIHRFNKSQQDALLGAVEKGVITLIGATTENPSFEVNSALLSRCQVYTLKALEIDELKGLLEAAMQKDEKLKKLSIEIKEYEALLNLSGGDARKLLNLFELVTDAHDKSDKISITNDEVWAIAQQRMAMYDKGGEQHYDIISAFIKSIRGSDPNAAVYWLSRMIAGGEDVKFIARRLLIAASEDIGNANPTALVIATNTFQAVTMIGYPESEIVLSQCAVYLACSPKSNASYKAIKSANQLVRDTGDLSVPLHLRNAPTKLMKDSGYSKGYKYAHDFPGNFVQQEFLPDKISGRKLYEPQGNARELEFKKRLQALWSKKYNYE
ncbi:replication-associated recombination protein A [Marivirga sp. S37H4]|uniref:Replication-associated recombination protein A n=1 Tax=Marivirga aurantiaca TaxID=2802615 RepID=A0A934WUY6_9BACT|nr:replication-associated recombination protein A [Marivirga aurantiaca]MBK6263504.1 replication-associated recombination protein A [Marivirga aurantiaca]